MLDPSAWARPDHGTWADPTPRSVDDATSSASGHIRAVVRTWYWFRMPIQYPFQHTSALASSAAAASGRYQM